MIRFLLFIWYISTLVLLSWAFDSPEEIRNQLMEIKGKIGRFDMELKTTYNLRRANYLRKQIKSRMDEAQELQHKYEQLEDSIRKLRSQLKTFDALNLVERKLEDSTISKKLRLGLTKAKKELQILIWVQSESQKTDNHY